MTTTGVPPPAWLVVVGFDTSVSLPWTTTSLARQKGAPPPHELEPDAPNAPS